MNTDNLDQAAPDQDSHELPRQQEQCGRWSRNWWWFVPVLVIVLGAGWGYWTFFGRVYCLDEYRLAMQKIGESDELRSKLGEPIQAVGWPPPGPRLEDREREVRWDIRGPKGQAKAHVHARLMQGKWEIIIMEVTFADGERVSLVETIDDAGDAPLFDGPKPEKEAPKTPEIDAPAPEITMPVPSM